MIRVYGITCDNGDGSSSIEFLESADLLELLEEHDPEAYGGNEGGFYTLDLVHTQTIQVRTRADVVEQLRDYHGYEGN